jgi:hypothetical protein
MPEEDPKDLIKLADPILAAKYKVGGIKDWIAREWPQPLDRYLGLLPKNVEDCLGELAEVEDHEDPAFDNDLVTGRYLVVKIVTYRAETDEAAYAMADTLEVAQTEVEDHLFGHTPREDYARICRVYDTHLKKELPFEEVQKIEWKL